VTVAAVAARERERAAPARSAAYPLFSQLVGSPNEPLEAPWALPPADLEETARALAAALPYPFELSPLAAAAARLGDGAAERLAAVYGACFEVGSDGPPIPLREALLPTAPPPTREEVVRFYSFFGYRLHEQVQWAPDHLAVELEFMHYLCHRESGAADGAEALSFRLAQRDFLARHPGAWVPGVRRGVTELAKDDPYYPALFAALESFLERDRAWQERTLAEEA